MDVEMFDIEGGIEHWKGTAGSSLPISELTNAPVMAENNTPDEYFDRFGSGDMNAHELALRSLKTASGEMPKEST